MSNENIYEQIIAAVENMEVNDQSDLLLQELGQQMQSRQPNPQTILRAAELVVKNPATDCTPLARILRLKKLISPDELNNKICTIIDTVFNNLPDCA